MELEKKKFNKVLINNSLGSLRCVNKKQIQILIEGGFFRLLFSIWLFW